MLQLPYSMEVNVSNPEALLTPQLNISAAGLVPTRMQTFRLQLPCSGRTSAEIDVVFTINVTLSKTARDVTPLVFRRHKICLQEEARRVDTKEAAAAEEVLVMVEEQKQDVRRSDTVRVTESSKSSVAVGFYIAIGCACGLIAALLTLTLALYIRNRKRRYQNYIR